MSESAVDEVVATPDTASGPNDAGAAAAQDVKIFDARRPDRLPKSHLRTVGLINENFVRSVTLSLSAYLRNYVSLNLSEVDQLSYRQFVDSVPACSCFASAISQPNGANALFEIDSPLAFAMLEILLGGVGKTCETVQRGLTEIEQMLMDALFRIIAHDLGDAWKHAGRIEFEVNAVAAEPQVLQAMNPAEAVVVSKIEVHLGEITGFMNIVLPSTAVTRMMQKLDDEPTARAAEAPSEDQERIFALLQPAEMQIEIRLPEQRICAKELLSLQRGDVLVLDLPVDAPVNLLVNGDVQFFGNVVSVGRKRGIQLGGAAGS
jgi:flagellar motor switch protein FliM